MEAQSDIAREAVLVHSEAVPEGTPVVQGNVILLTDLIFILYEVKDRIWKRLCSFFCREV